MKISNKINSLWSYEVERRIKSKENSLRIVKEQLELLYQQRRIHQEIKSLNRIRKNNLLKKPKINFNKIGAKRCSSCKRAFKIENLYKNGVCPDCHKKWRSDYYTKNRDKEVARQGLYVRNNLKAKIANRLRKRLSQAIKNKSSHIKNLGCSIEFLIKYIENKFEDGMTWDNWGIYGWHIDHIKPLSSFDLTDPAQVKEACNYTNLQPLWAKDNLSKSNK